MNGRLLAGSIAVLCVFGLGFAALRAGSETSEIVADASGPVETTSATPSEDETAVAQSQESEAGTNNEAQETEVSLPIPENFGAADTLVELDGWLQTEATSLEDFDGQVKILQFWTFSCHNCKATIPTLQHLYETYEPDGLEIIGVHAPEFSFEEDSDAVLAAAQDLGVTWPIAIDNKKRNFRSWQGSRRFWPRTYVIDTNGDIRFDHIGEGAYDELEETVAYLVQNGGA